MSGKTNIEWTDATWNPVTGCTKVSAGCKFCYAERGFHRPYPGRHFTDVRCHPDRLDQPIHWTRPRRIFVNSMSDLFHEAIEPLFLGKVFGLMAEAHWHNFQVLTKRPAAMQEWSREVMHYPRGDRHQKPVYGWPPNVWLGVSVEDQKTADERIPLLLQMPAAVLFVSYEPALGPVDFTFLNSVESTGDAHHPLHVRNNLGGLDWIIAGGESGPHARPSHPDWFRSVRNECQAAGVPFFFKQWGGWGPHQPEGESRKETWGKWWVDGKFHFGGTGLPLGALLEHSNDMYLLGKRRAGRLLDGREWNEYPKVAP